LGEELEFVTEVVVDQRDVGGGPIADLTDGGLLESLFREDFRRGL
jgi:hypothetical protein